MPPLCTTHAEEETEKVLRFQKSGSENDGDETWNVCKSAFNKNPNYGSSSDDQRVVEGRRATDGSEDLSKNPGRLREQ